MSKKFICIFSNSLDRHLTEATKFLGKEKIIVIYSDDDSGNNEVGFNLKQGFFLRYANKIIYPQELKVIWFRKPGQWWAFDPHKLTRKEIDIMEYKRGEISRLINEFINYCKQKGVPIICDPLAPLTLDYKLDQILVARKIGFRVPDTLVTDNYKQIENFIMQHGKKVIIKNLGSHPYSKTFERFDPQTFEMNLKIFKKYIKDNPLDYAIFIQEKIEKKFELRVTIFGNKIFTCRIDSQNNPYTKIDWRANSSDKLKHSPYKLPKKLKNMCLELLRAYRLYYGAIDIAVTPEGDYVFFENNPYGQYLWIEDLTGMKMSQAMAELLLSF